MIHAVLQRYDISNTGDTLFVVHSYDKGDITNLIPQSEINILPEERLIQMCQEDKENCSNFSVLPNGTLKTPNGLPTQYIPDSMILPPKLELDDVWNFLYKLQQVPAFLIVSNNGLRKDDFIDDEACYLIPTKRLTYSTTHANCVAHYLSNGTLVNPETDEVQTSKRWTTYKIVMHNEIKRRYLTVILDDNGLQFIKNNSTISIKSFKLTESYNLPVDDLEALDTSNGINYCVVDLHSLPLVNINIPLISNYHLIYNAVEMLNVNTIQTKVFKAFITELVNLHPTLNTFMATDDVYKEKFISDDDNKKHNGVKFSISGSSSVPSVNACIKALKNPQFTKVSDFLNSDIETLDELDQALYKLNFLQKNAITTLIHLSKEYITTKNPDTCYTSADYMNKLFLQQRELCKARLTYIRSIFMTNLHPDMYKLNKLFSSDVNDNTVFINFGEF